MYIYATLRPPSVHPPPNWLFVILIELQAHPFLRVLANLVWRLSITRAARSVGVTPLLNGVVPVPPAPKRKRSASSWPLYLAQNVKGMLTRGLYYSPDHDLQTMDTFLPIPDQECEQKTLFLPNPAARSSWAAKVTIR